MYWTEDAGQNQIRSMALAESCVQVHSLDVLPNEGECSPT
jgi:hypothetical protein